MSPNVTTVLVLTVASLTSLTSATVRVNIESPFCSLSLPRLRCVFTNTTQNVELGEEKIDGVQEVVVEAAAHLHASPQCLTNLVVGSSKDVQIQGGDAINTENTSSTAVEKKGSSRLVQQDQGRVQSSRHQQSRGNTSHHRTRRSDGGYSVGKLGSGAHDGEVGQEKQSWCRRNVTVRQSHLLRLRGQFDRADIHLSRNGELSGEMRVLDIERTSPLTLLDAKVDEVTLTNCTVQNVTHLEVTKRLLIENVRIGRVGPQGLFVNGRSQQQGQGSQDFVIRSVGVNVMEGGALRVRGGHLSVNDLTVATLHDGSVVVEPGGKLTLNNVHVMHASYASLLLTHNATLILNNFTLKNKTIPHMELFTSDSQVFVLPLLAISPRESVNVTQEEAYPGFAWYWLVVMAMVGQVSGLVIGSAVMWRRPDLTLPSISLSELLGRDKLREEEEGHTNEGMCRPDYQRQDSGLTSSSFTSFAAGHERQPSATLAPPSYKPSTPEPEAANSSTYVQVQFPRANPEEVIYEEVEEFAQPRPDSMYLPMQ